MAYDITFGYDVTAYGGNDVRLTPYEETKETEIERFNQTGDVWGLKFAPQKLTARKDNPNCRKQKYAN